MRKLLVIVPLLLATGPNLGSGGVLVLKDEGVSQGSVSSINCSGTGVTCTRSGTTGTVTVSGGVPAVVDPLYSDGGSIACLPAASGTAGCISASDQVMGSGTKIFEGDLWLGGYVRVVTNGQAIVFDGRRIDPDPGAEVTIRGMNSRAYGQILDLRPRDTGSVFSVDNNGVVTVAGLLPSDGGSAPFGQIRDGTAVAGHALIVGSPGLGLTMQGKFNDPTAPTGTYNVLIDGGLSPDGGYWAYAGRHGDVTVGASFPRTAGMLFDVQNPISGIGLYTDKKFYVDYLGGFGNAGGQNRADFGACPSEFQLMYDGLTGMQFRYGHEPSTLLYAFDEERWYVCQSTGWAKVPLLADVPSGSPLTTKGDLFTFTTVDARKAVGADGLCLKANSAEATGLEWAACSAGGGISYAEAAAAVMGGF